MDIITVTDWVNWGAYVNFGMRGPIYFLLVIFVTIWAVPDFFSERKWAVIIALLGPIVYELLMFSYFAISNIYAPAFWFTMLVVSLLYMAVIPLMATIQRTRKDDVRGSARVIWFWVVLIGILLWFFGDAILAAEQFLQLPGYANVNDELSLLLNSAHASGWYLILIGFIFQQRASKADTS
jgi:hypothetical protein